MYSNLFHINLKDAGTGLAIAVLLPVLKYIENILTHGSFSIDWSNLLNLAIGGFIAGIAKEFLTDNQGHVLGIGTP